MPNVFDITTPSGSVELSEQGTGSVSITVTNSMLEETVHGRVVVKPLGNTSAEWLAVDGGADQAFAPKQTQQFKININVPQGTPEGTYSFRLDAFDVENPDEHFDEGQAIAFSIAVQDEPQKEPFKFPWWGYAIAGVVIVGVILITQPWNWFGNGTQTVPDLTDKPYNEALKLTIQKGFDFGVPNNRLTRNREEVGLVLDQNPKTGTQAPPGSVVDMWVGVYSGPKPPSPSITDIRVFDPMKVFQKAAAQKKERDK